MRMHNVDVKSSVWISWITWISWIIIHEIHENAKVTFADEKNLIRLSLIISMVPTITMVLQYK